MRLFFLPSLFCSFSLALIACGGESGHDAGPLPDGAVVDGPAHCATNADCSDHVFCNGDEICQPFSMTADARGCVRLPPTCLTGQICDEVMATCVTDCGVARDADGDGHQAVVCGGDDCDDADAMRFPSNAEVCDDAAHDEDCDAATFGRRDADGDGSVDALCCNVGPTGTRVCGDDCNDARTHIGPHATEVCNGVDDDCNGMVDDGVLVAAFEDQDHDLHGDPAHAVMACPFAAGISLLGDDCDDADPAKHPAQAEICDGVDNDCNGTVDDFTHAVTWYADLDADGFGNAASGTMISCTPLPGYSLLPTDCDDAHHGIGPAANEICDGLDDDCNGLADFIVAPGDFEDDDGDGAIDARCPRVGNDCDDLDEAVRPGAAEICDGKDDDCNGMIDDGTGSITWYVDIDGDGYGDDHAATTMSCMKPPGRVARGGDCDDSADTIHPGAVDGCNGHDDDCNGVVDDDSPRAAYYVDADGDGAGVGVAVLACVAPPGDGTTPNDCDDTSAAIYPGAIELCNGIDDDCDGMTDVAVTTTFYPDDDGDGHGAVGSAGHVGCAPGLGYAPNSDDCDDTNAAVHPGATEICDAIDDDCDGTIDGAAAAGMCRAAHGTSTCTAGACAIASCVTNYADCDHTVFDGCETDVRVSPTHCGTCTHACGIGDACVASACAVSPFVQVTGGTSFNCARRASGGVACWGLGTSGQLGDGGFVSSSVPVATTVTDAIDIAAGADHACAVRRGGTVVCWGGDASGQLGDGGTTINRALPSPVVGITDAVDVSAGGYFTCAVHATGAVSCWGGNSYGQLGSPPGAPTSSAIPVAVPVLTDAVTVTTGDVFACALSASNTVSCWGYNGQGCLGDGTTIDRSTPAPVSGITTAISLATSEYARGTCAVLGSGDVRCWGVESNGQFGDGVPGIDYLPVAPVGLHDALASALATYTTCWLRAGGTVTCAGWNNNGELGDGTATSTTVPGPDIPTLSGVTSIGGGNDTLCATLSTGGVKCWGVNTYGEVGDGTTTQANVPTTVLGIP